jgi:hypothetical protein
LPIDASWFFYIEHSLPKLSRLLLENSRVHTKPGWATKVAGNPAMAGRLTDETQPRFRGGLGRSVP